MVDLRAAQELESRPMTAPVAPGPRERLLTSAERLTGRQGVGVGVDAILEDAAVARRSLYQHFGGKDELIATSLRESARRDEERYRAALDSGGDDPRQRILAVIDQLDTTTSNPDFPGCRFVSAELSLRNPNHPAHAVTRAYTERLHDLFEKELADLGHPDPEAGADQLLVLLDGVLVIAALRRGTHPARAIRPLVERLLDEGEVADTVRAN